MANKQEEQGKWFEIKDNDGKVIDSIYAPSGGALYRELSTGSGQVYMPNRDDEETYVSVSEAKANVSIDPTNGQITVTGPKWLTSQIVNSDSFKKNYSENSSLLGLVNMYRNDSESTIVDQTTGDPIKVTDALKVYEDSANSYAAAFGAIQDYKADKEKKYGVSMSDNDVYVANNFYNKADYDKNGVIYIPNWAMNKYDWESLDSWDSEHRSISAEDFFNNVFSEDFGDQTASTLQKWSEDMIEGFVYNNAYSPESDDDKQAKEDMLSDEGYADELARTIQMRSLVTQNKPEAGAAYSAIMFTGGVLRTWAEDAGNAVVSVTSGFMQATESITRVIPTEIDDFVASPVYISAGIVGEMINMLRSGPHGQGAIDDWVAGLREDVNAVLDHDTSTNAGDLINSRRDELNQAFDDFSADMQKITGAWMAGEMFGHLAWKITENVILIDKVGRGVGAAVASLGSASGAATVMSKVMSAESVGKIFGVLGGAANFFAQGTLETYLDNKDLLDKAVASGNIFDTELWGKIAENTIWNGLAEGATKYAGVFARTKAGKAAQLMLTKPISATASKINKGKVALSMWLHRWTPDQIAQAASSLAEGSAKTVGAEMMNTAATKYISEMQEMASKIRVFGKTGEEIADSINEAYAKLDLNPATELAKREAAEAGDEAAEALAAVKKASSGVEENYELLRRAKTIQTNFENRIDEITKGVSVMQTRMEQSTGEALPEFQTAANKVTGLEGKMRAQGRLTFTEGGTFLSREGSQYLAWSSQYRQYQWRAANELAQGASKEAIEAQKAAREFLPQVEEKLAQLRGILGDELADAYDDLLPKTGEFHKRILDYMISHNYLGDEEVAQIMLARSQGWGKDGVYYIPTARLTDEDAILGFSTVAAKKTNKAEAQAFFNRKTLSDGLYNLKPGNIDQEFADPLMTLYSKVRTMATIGQAQEISRSVRAASILSRGISKFDEAGISEYDKDLVKKGFDGLKKSFNDTFKSSKGAFADSVRNEFTESGIFESAFKQKDYVEQYGAASDRLRNAESALDKVTKPWKKDASAFLKTANGSETEYLLNLAPSDMEVPTFDIRSLRASTFDDWFNILPERSQKYIEKTLKQQNYAKNVTNVKKVASSTEGFQLNLKKQFIDEYADEFGKNSDYWDFIKTKKIAQLEAENNTTLATARKEYEDALSNFKTVAKDGGEPVKFEAEKIKSLGEDFSIHIDNIYERLVGDISDRMRASNPAFGKMAEQLLEDSNGAFKNVEEAERYIVLNQFDKMKAKDFAAPILDTMGGQSKSAAQTMAEKLRGANGDKVFTKLSKSFGDGLKEKATSELNTTLNALKKSGGDKAIDIDGYWKRVKEYISDIEQKGVFRAVRSDGTPALDFDTSKLVQMVDTDGVVKFYEVDPMAAILINKTANFRYTPSKNAIIDSLSRATARFSQIFRWGTTGVDIPSYVNQWFRDPMDATIVGFARPLTDLDFGSVKSVGASLVWDSIPGARLTKFGQRVLGNSMTARITDKVIDATFDTTKEGLIAQFGKEWWDDFAVAATKGLSGDAAEQALRRAAVEFSADTIGASSLPNMGAMTEAQFYRASTGTMTTAKEVRKEQLNFIYGNGMTKEEIGAFKSASEKMWEGFDNFIEKTSRGDFREQISRRAVWTTQYRNAIQSGMTMQEARIWATRYALDSTTDFNRTFMFANQFIHSVPYLGAAINGQKSFLRLLELDPVGVMSRFTNNLIIPYSALLTKSLSDPNNREVYKTIREYEKQDSMILVYKGEKIQIPLPQQLSRFLAPIRHAIEEAAGVQDASWWNLATSDILGIFPIDLSGFVDLDGNTLLSGDEETGLSAHISRGVEKAASSLMSPVVKSLYMWKTGRDPYTGREIDTSYVTQDEDGNDVIIDSTQSAIAKWLAGFDENLSASAAKKILQGLFGRSTISVLDGALEILSGDFSLKSGADALAEQLSHSVDGGSGYDKARSDWNNAIRMAYDKREEMLNDDAFQKDLATIRNSNSPESKVEGAKRNYQEKMDQFSSYVLGIAKMMKEKYPEQYTRTRAAQIISLLTMPTGYTVSDTAYATEMQKDEYYNARAQAISTYLKMGFKEDAPGISILGAAYYDKASGEYKFKEFTPYEIELMNSNKYNTSDQLQAMIKSALSSAEIKSSEMWSGYYAAKKEGKTALKEYQNEWNARVVKALYPVMSRYGANSVLSDSATRDLLEDYVLISNPYKKKQYLYQIFGGDL